jgi:release factor glutamine methyltransferase
MTSDRPVDTIGGAISVATAKLRAGGLSSPRLDAELLLGHLLGRSRTRLAIDAADQIDPDYVTKLDTFVARRLAGEPIAYLIGHREFMGHDFVVGPGVLVPRPETEMLVERAVSMIERRWPSGPVGVLDLCTGSGAIALSLALKIERTNARQDKEVLHYDQSGPPDQSSPRNVFIVGSDISPNALAYARANQANLGLEGVVNLVQGDLLAWTDGPWDLILSNPPYLRPDQIDGNPEISAEPRLALDGGVGGIELIERLLDQAAARVSSRFGMIVEVDPDHADAVRVLAAAHFPGASVIIIPDLSGRDRFISIEREECAT